MTDKEKLEALARGVEHLKEIIASTRNSNGGARHSPTELDEAFFSHCNWMLDLINDQEMPSPGISLIRAAGDIAQYEAVHQKYITSIQEQIDDPTSVGYRDFTCTDGRACWIHYQWWLTPLEGN